jgi:hypothetical protein
LVQKERAFSMAEPLRDEFSHRLSKAIEIEERIKAGFTIVNIGDLPRRKRS